MADGHDRFIERRPHFVEGKQHLAAIAFLDDRGDEFAREAHIARRRAEDDAVSDLDPLSGTQECMPAVRRFPHVKCRGNCQR